MLWRLSIQVLGKRVIGQAFVLLCWVRVVGVFESLD